MRHMRQNLMQHNTHDSGIEPDSLSLQDIIEIADTYHMDLTHPDPEQLRAAVERDLDGCEFWLLPSLMSGGIYGSIEMIGPFIIARYRDDGPRPQQVQAQYHELLHVVKGQISPGQKLIFKDRRRLWTPMERQCESGARILTRYTLLGDPTGTIERVRHELETPIKHRPYRQLDARLMGKRLR